jgi:indole-3-glycerol phosphate synthase
MILDDIIAARRADLAAAREAAPLADLRERPGWSLPRRGFAAALRARRPAVIAEVKKASPSKGVIRADFDPVAIARRYADCGAAAISVLTEERYFQGSPDLQAIRDAVDLPLLRKDFLFDSYQLAEARAWGADAALLIVAMLDDTQLRELHSAALELGLDVLVEAHSHDEVVRAVDAGATLIGVTIVISTPSSPRWRPPSPAVSFPEGTLAVAERHRDGRRCGAGCVRPGTTRSSSAMVIRSTDPGAALRAPE